MKKEDKLDIIYEDKDFIAIDKPEGLLSIENEKDIVSAYSYVSEYLRLNNKLERPFVIHRIDKETSGVLVFAKNPYVQSKLRLEWNKYVVLREYIALVEGEMPKKSDRIVVNLLEDKNNMVYVAKGHDGKTSITNYEVIKTDGKYSLLRVLIDTGRKNQIRVVLANLGHPIVDDVLLQEDLIENGYLKYENYDAIDVPYTDSIPVDYEGIMGVPVTFLDKYCPEQFSIIGFGSGYLGQSIGIKGIPPEHKKLMKGHSAAGDLYMMVNGLPKVPYARILIRKKE